jgi:hypothetical protein
VDVIIRELRNKGESKFDLAKFGKNFVMKLWQNLTKFRRNIAKKISRNSQSFFDNISVISDGIYLKNSEKHTWFGKNVKERNMR